MASGERARCPLIASHRSKKDAFAVALSCARLAVRPQEEEPPIFSRQPVTAGVKGRQAVVSHMRLLAISWAARSQPETRSLRGGTPPTEISAKLSGSGKYKSREQKNQSIDVFLARLENYRILANPTEEEVLSSMSELSGTPQRRRIGTRSINGSAGWISCPPPDAGTLPPTEIGI